jgi:cardiolipin synthase
MLRVLLVAAGLVAGHQRVLGITRRPCWPPPPDAITSDGAQAATAAFVARDEPRPRDAALPFAWSTAATVEPHVDGERFFPAILADVEAARSSVHILMFGWREGEIGMRMARLLERKLAEGVAVRVIVDGLGSRPYWNARSMFRSLVAQDAEIVVNDVVPPVRRGRFPDGRLDRRQSELGRADHRKLYVIDGRVAWIGGAGIEDHFADGRFHDLMVRVTGAVVRQAQAAFLTSHRGHGAAPPADLSPLFPAPEDAGSIPIALAQVIPGGHVAASQAIAAQISAARTRLDVMNPYFTDPDIVERIVAVARAGAKVRIVVAETSNSAQASAALRHRYAELTDAGAEVWELPGVVVHAKVVVADDVVSFGTVNLDAWALYRNSEIAMLAESATLAAQLRDELFDPDVARSRPGAAPTTTGERLQCARWSRLAYYL